MDNKTKQDVVSGVLVYGIVLRKSRKEQCISGKTLVEIWNEKSESFKKHFGFGTDDSYFLPLIERYVESIKYTPNGAVCVMFKNAD